MKAGKKRLVFIVGPTGIGKSKVAIELAKKIKGEIISCDSMQVYRNMDILTSKVLPGEKAGIAHHMIDIISPGSKYDVAKYRKQALALCDKLLSQKKTPLFVGGTGLYYSVVIDGLFPNVAQDLSIRSRLEKQLKQRGKSYLYKRLERVDKPAALKIHPNDSRRVIRALEVFLKTGKRISELQKERQGLDKGYEARIFGLKMDREQLYSRIDTRVDEMFDKGLLGEVKLLIKNRLSKTAGLAIGINELKGYFLGAYSLEQAKLLIQKNSRNYAKRQLTWFKNDKRIQWIEVKTTDSPIQVSRKIWKKLSW